MSDNAVRKAERAAARPFNSPLECGLRMLFVLNASPDSSADLQRMVSYDYLLVHSGDVPEGPKSLHPAVPFRGGELLVRRDIVSVGLDEMFSRELVSKTYDTNGMRYSASGLTGPFLALLKSDYAANLRERAEWLVGRFGDLSDSEFSKYMNEHVGRWGAEFDRLGAIEQLEL